MSHGLLRNALDALDALERSFQHAQTVDEIDACLAALDAAAARLHRTRWAKSSPRPCTEKKRPRDALDDEFDAPMRPKGARLRN